VAEMIPQLKSRTSKSGQENAPEGGGQTGAKKKSKKK